MSDPFRYQDEMPVPPVGESHPPPAQGIEQRLLKSRWRHFVLNILSPALLTFILFLGLIFGLILPTMKRNIIDRKKEMIRELTHAAWSELAGMQRQEAQGLISREDAQREAMDRIEQMRYGEDGKDYFWISDIRTHMVMHPYRPDLNGKSLLDYSDPAGKKLFVEVTGVVEAQGDGYVDYLWQWKDDEQLVVPKLSYVKGFEPWGWIVGTGIYIEDVRAEIARMTRQVLQISVGISVAIALLLVNILRQGLNLERSRWHAESALRESEEKYRLLVESSAEGILLVLQGRPVYANRNLLARLGYAEGELPDVPLDRILELVARGESDGSETEQRARLLDRSGGSEEVLLTSSRIAIGNSQGQIFRVKQVGAGNKTRETIGRLVADLQSMLPLATRSIKGSSLPLVDCTLDTPAEKAAALMARSKCGAVLVRAPDGTPVGIVTDSDLRSRVLAEGLDPARPVAAIMTAPLIRVEERALLFEAARLMQERGVQHLVVTDVQGQVLGILDAAEILHAQGHAIGSLLGEIQAARTPEEVRDARAKLLVFVKALLDSGARVESITRIMTTVSDAILGRLIALAEAEIGAAPAPFAFVALGSEAREEQTLATDQDNAIIYAQVPAESAGATRDYFLRLGGMVCDWLDFVGYRRCKGATMASNPKWCRSLPEWLDFVSECVASASAQNLLDVNVFLDLRCAHGQAEFVTAFRGHLHKLLEGGQRHAFFFHLAKSTLQFKPPRGFFGNIQLEATGEQQAAFNIKAAIIPLVNFARIYALQNRLAETNTLDRLAGLRALGQLLPSSHDELVQAYTALMQMRLAHQAAQAGQGIEPDNFIDLGTLTQIEQSMLKKIFGDIAIFQARMEMDFARVT